MPHWLSAKEHFRATCATVEALRRGYKQLVLNLSTWLPTVLGFEAGDLPGQFERWRRVGVDDSWTQLLCDLEVRCARGRLFVARRWSGSDGVTQMASVAR